MKQKWYAKQILWDKWRDADDKAKDALKRYWNSVEFKSGVSEASEYLREAYKVSEDAYKNLMGHRSLSNA